MCPTKSKVTETEMDTVKTRDRGHNTKRRVTFVCQGYGDTLTTENDVYRVREAIK